MSSLEIVSAAPDAASLLKVPLGAADQIRANTSIRHAATSQARDIYCGVLYDALSLNSMDPSAKRRASRTIVIVSALFGAVRLTDRIPAYRLSMGVSLPLVGSLARWWRPHLRGALDPVARQGLILDTRSAAYASAWVPPQDAIDRWAHISVPGATHDAKRIRGEVVRQVCLASQQPHTITDLADLLKAHYSVQVCPPRNATSPTVVQVGA